MEDVVRRSGHGCLDKEEKLDDSIAEGASGEDLVAKVGRKRAYQEREDLKSSLSEHNKDLSYTKQAVVAINNQERSTMESDSKASSSSQKEQDNSLESARAEMVEVREENQRLKMCLGQMMKDYQALQMKFYYIKQQEETNKSSTSTVDNNNHDQQDEEPEFISLSLGRFSSESKREEKRKFPFNQEKEDEKANNGGLSLGLECKFEVPKSQVNDQPLPSPHNLSPVNSFEEPKEEAGETWPPNKVIKTMPNGEDEKVQQSPLKKARVCVRARCDTPTMNDGCQWRKYGQKIAKGNPCPRAYYRCTVAPSCPVRKQVQRCAEDMSILITTYEGTHNHSLPLSATAMASTTSAAASMLLSGSSSSSTSQTGPNNISSTTTPADLHGLNFYLSDSSNTSKQFYLHHNSSSSFSASPAHPTITLDLTSSNPSSHFNRFSSHPIPKIGHINTLNFTSSESHAINWGTNGFFSYGSSTSQIPYNRAKSAMENNHHFQTYLQKKTTATTPDTIAAATKAITADPSFQSALAAALTSIVGSGSSSGGGGGAGGENLVQKLKWGESFPVAGSTNYSLSSPTNKSNIACATSYLNKTTSANSQAGNNLMFLPPSSILPFSSPKTKSASSSPGGDNRDHHAN